MDVDEMRLACGGYEQRFAVHLGSAKLKMVRRPVSIAPPDGTVCLVDNGPRSGSIPRRSAGTFKDGEWKGVRFEPTHWTRMDDE